MIAATDQAYMGFIGVTTGSSSIMTVFPRWAQVLGLPTERLVGHDVPLNSDPEVYRRLVGQIHEDPSHLGALVTTHKMAVYQSADDLFDELDDLATTFGEISSISKRGTRLAGAAKDPVTVRLAYEEFLAPDHFSRTGAAALILGSGGAGNALSHQLGTRADRPSEVICTALNAADLDHARELHERAGIDPAVMRYVVTAAPDEVAGLVSALPSGSLVANATGMGKDIPGTPVPADTQYPSGSLVWEFNYRGSLEFLHHARAQQTSRNLTVVDGWRYFIHGWSQVVAEVFDIELTADIVEQLSTVAAESR